MDLYIKRKTTAAFTGDLPARPILFVNMKNSSDI